MLNPRLTLCFVVLSMVAPVAVARKPAHAAQHAVTTPEEWDADIAMRLGEHAYLGGDVPAALAAFQSAASKDPRRVEAHWRISHCLAVLDRIPEALSALERARALAPRDPRVLNTLAVVQMKSGNLARATEFARRAVRQAPRVADVWDTLGWTYLQSGDRERARTAFQTALRLDSSHASAKEGLAKSRQH